MSVKINIGPREEDLKYAGIYKNSYPTDLAMVLGGDRDDIDRGN